MNNTTQNILHSLYHTPELLKEILTEIPEKFHRRELIKDKWTIHEHATHIAVGDIYGFHKRLEQFKTEKRPIIEPLSGDNLPRDFFINLDLERTMEEFFEIRSKTIALAKDLKPEDWHKEADHPEYKKYTPYIMLRHLLMHDHTHMYKIEDMGFGTHIQQP